MENQYKRTTTTVSFINYHFVFFPRFRRKIFDIPGVEERFREMVSFIYKKNAILILAME
ncbi:MAG: transposase [Clostridia bacterium]|nr:transposase [Clostridia bacterium]